MHDYITLDNLQLIFGKGKKLEQAKEMLADGHTNEEIRKETGCAVGVRNVSLDIKKGELFVIVGLSGSGKSSLIRCFNGLNKPTEGSVVIGGTDIAKASKEELLNFRRNKISMVFQSFGLLSHRNVLENVEYGLEIKKMNKTERTQIALNAIKVVGLSGWESYYPNQLSGGMKQRVGLARAVANNPKVLLMDEPYSALDPLIRRNMQNELLNLEDYIDKTIIFITHDMNEAFKLGDRIALMKDGIIVQLGKPNEFFEHPENDYVIDFIADVDKTQVLKAKQIMDEISITFTPNTLRTKVRKTLENKEMDFVYIVNEADEYQGYVTLEDVQNSRVREIKSLIKNDVEPFYRQRFIKDLITILDDANYEVPIVDSKNRLKGTVSYEHLVSAIS